jgi:hypothetical protein
MKRLVIATLSMAALTLASGAPAQERMTREQWQQLSPEEREASKARAQARWQSMTPDEQAAAKDRMRERYESLPPERQAELRRELQDRRAAKSQ